MVVPTLFVGVQAIRTNALERATLEALGQRLASLGNYADVEGAMLTQTQVIWRYLSGDPAAKREFPLTEQVVSYWLDRWTAGLPPDEVKHAEGVRQIEADIRAVAARVFKLHEGGQRGAAALIARRELVERLQATPARVKREIYRQARARSWCSPKSWRRSGRWRPRWPTGCESRWRVCGPPPSSPGTASTRRPRVSSSMPSWSRWTASTSASPICCNSRDRRRFIPCGRACGRWWRVRSPALRSCCASVASSWCCALQKRSPTFGSIPCDWSRP